MLLPFDLHVTIVKLLSLRDALAYAQVTPVTREAVQYVFTHRVQLDFGSVLGPNGQIILPDDTIMEVLHAHVRAEAITNFSVQSTFRAFTALEQYMRSHWIPMHDSSGFPTGVGHGILSNIRYPTNTYYGGATPQQGQQLLAIWSQFHDDYGVFCIVAANFNSIPPLNNAPANWSTQNLQEELESLMASNSSSDSEDPE
jgi:hypothetical protein